MDNQTLQHQLFQEIKRKMAPNVSAVDEIAGLLNISSDSAYRRIRGDKPITLDELEILCRHFRISLDQLMNIQTDAFLFFGKNLGKQHDFIDYTKNMLGNMIYMNKYAQKDMYYLCKDVPIFHHYHFRDIAAFKYYFWVKSLLHYPEFVKKKFSFDDYPDELFEMGRKILDLYNQMNSVEIWNVESINSTIRQIEFYREAGMFESNEDVWRIYDAVEMAINHLENQAAQGFKYSYGEKSPVLQGSFQMYFNEMFLGDNSILCVLDGAKIIYHNHTTLDYMYTRDPEFTEHAFEYIQNLMRKSTLISSVSEKERSAFFRVMRDKIARRKAGLKI